MRPSKSNNSQANTKRERFNARRDCKKLDKNQTVIVDDERSHVSLEVTDPTKILLLCQSLSDSSTWQLEKKVNSYLRVESLSTTVFQILLRHHSGEAVVQVVNELKLAAPLRAIMPDDFYDHMLLLEHGCLKCNAALDHNLTELIERVLDGDAGEVIAVPIVSRRRRSTDDECQQRSVCPIYLVCFVNSRRSESHVIRLTNECFRFCLNIMVNTVESEEEARLKRQSQYLLTVARKLFTRLVDLTELLKEIMMEARLLTNAERCSLFLVDRDTKDLVAKVFDGVTPSTLKTEVRIHGNEGIAGYVAATGRLLNIKDAYEHPLFFKRMDEATGFRTRNILCFPIKDEKGVVGVAQLCNKKDGRKFDIFDEEIATAFSIYCGLSIVHSLLYKEIKDAHARSRLSNELMIYYMQVSTSDVADLLLCPGIHQHPGLNDFYFSPRDIILKETPCFVLKMLSELRYIEEFNVKKETLVRFILYVQRGYRDAPYHNWWHAFSVAHFAYLCIRNFGLEENGYLTKLECFSYIIACLCHDIDHRGTTNSFQQTVNNTLASLYSSKGSVMERHHLSQTLCILNTHGCNFLANLSNEEYGKCLDYIQDMILATDLAIHFKICGRQTAMVREGYKRNKPEHRYCLVSLLMTCGDLSDQTKDWSTVRMVALKVYEEFFMQGDLEKQMGRVPMYFMNRETASIPDLQVEFLKGVCLPLFKLLVALFPVAKMMVRNIKKNLLCWETSKNLFKKNPHRGNISLQALTAFNLEKEVLKIVDDVTHHRL